MYSFTGKIPKIKNKSSRRVQKNYVILWKKTGCQHNMYMIMCDTTHSTTYIKHPQRVYRSYIDRKSKF